jgi:hypothetical protein
MSDRLKDEVIEVVNKGLTGPVERALLKNEAFCDFLVNPRKYPWEMERLGITMGMLREEFLR